MKDGGPAFPETRWNDMAQQEIQWMGMTLRDYFAASAVMRTVPAAEGNNALPSAEHIAHYAYKIADAMLEERDK